MYKYVLGIIYMHKSGKMLVTYPKVNKSKLYNSKGRLTFLLLLLLKNEKKKKDNYYWLTLMVDVWNFRFLLYKLLYCLIFKTRKYYFHNLKKNYQSLLSASMKYISWTQNLPGTFQPFWMSLALRIPANTNQNFWWHSREMTSHD